jgi:hypothetical protein
MVVNFKAREINRGTCKLARTPILIIIIIKKTLIHHNEDNLVGRCKTIVISSKIKIN